MAQLEATPWAMGMKYTVVFCNITSISHPVPPVIHGTQRDVLARQLGAAHHQESKHLPEYLSWVAVSCLFRHMKIKSLAARDNECWILDTEYLLHEFDDVSPVWKSWEHPLIQLEDVFHHLTSLYGTRFLLMRPHFNQLVSLPLLFCFHSKEWSCCLPTTFWICTNIYI